MVSDRERKSNWSIVAAIVGITIVLAFALGAYVTALSYPKQERYQSYGQSQADQQGSALAVADAAPLPQNKTPCVAPQTEGEADLCAQWRAARAAEQSADWTRWGVLASIVGISFLLWQIMLTREAVKDTGDATKAMQESNEIAREVMQRQLRAYVGATNFQIKDFCIAKFPRSLWTVKNFGQTPAYNVQIIASIFITDITEKGIRFNHTFKVERDIQPGEEYPVPYNWHFEVDEFIIHNFKKEIMTFVYAGVIRYRDTSGKRRYTTFKKKVALQGFNGDTGAGSMINCIRGNRSN